MPFSQRLTLAWERLIGDQWGITGRTQEYTIHAAKALNLDHAQDPLMLLSAGITAQLMQSLSYGGSAVPCMTLVTTDQPVDLVITASNVRLFALVGSTSNISIATGSALTTLWTKSVAGSNASVDATFPLP